jgi:DNA-directed RNA polymerase alpha subunit
MDRIEILELSARTYNHLKRNGINFIEQIDCMTDEDILKIKRVGKNALIEIRESLKEYKTM